MSPPVVKNVCKSAREEEDYKSFGQWYDGENNIYIGRNAAKYAQRGVYDMIGSIYSLHFVVCSYY